MDKILKSAVKRELVQLVPSQWMEKYLKGRKKFTDWEKATLILKRLQNNLELDMPKK